MINYNEALTLMAIGFIGILFILGLIAFCAGWFD